MTAQAGRMVLWAGVLVMPFASLSFAGAGHNIDNNCQNINARIETNINKMNNRFEKINFNQEAMSVFRQYDIYEEYFSYASAWRHASGSLQGDREICLQKTKDPPASLSENAFWREWWPGILGGLLGLVLVGMGRALLVLNRARTAAQNEVKDIKVDLKKTEQNLIDLKESLKKDHKEVVGLVRDINVEFQTLKSRLEELLQRQGDFREDGRGS